MGAVRARTVGCLTEPGIVCFPAVERSTQKNINQAQGRETLRGQRRSSGRPCPNRAHPRSPHKNKKPFRQTGTTTLPSLISSKIPAQLQAGRRGSGRGCRLSDRVGHRLLPGRVALNAKQHDQNSRPESITRPPREFRQPLPGPRRNAPPAKSQYKALHPFASLLKSPPNRAHRTTNNIRYRARSCNPWHTAEILRRS